MIFGENIASLNGIIVDLYMRSNVVKNKKGLFFERYKTFRCFFARYFKSL